MELDDTVCYCFHVSKRKLLNYIRIHEPRRASQISECGGAGTGCGWCISFIKRYFEQSSAAAAAAAVAAESDGRADDMTADEYARARGRYIRSGQGKPPAGAIPPPTED